MVVSFGKFFQFRIKFVRQVFDSGHVFTPISTPCDDKWNATGLKRFFFLNFYDASCWKIIVEETFINVKFCNYLLWNFRVVKYPFRRFFHLLLLLVFVPCFKK